MPTKRQAGQLRDKMHFQRRGMADDGFGNTLPNGEFETAFDRWVSLAPRVGGEEVTAARLAGKQPYVCMAGYDSDMLSVTVGWQLVDAEDENRVFNVASPPADPDAKRAWLEFIVIEGKTS